MKLLYITNGINGSGGLERVLSIKASYLAEEYGYDVTILSLNNSHQNPFYEFSSKITMRSISAGGIPLKYLREYQSGIQQLVNEVKPDIISVCDDGFKGFFIPLFLQTKAKIVYERHVSKLIEAHDGQGVLKTIIVNAKWRLMEGLAGKFSKFIVLTEGNKKEWRTLKNLDVIPNPLSFYPEEISPLDQKTLISVGKISYQKGQDLLLQAWEKVFQKYPDWKLVLYGKADEGFLDPSKWNYKNVSHFPPEKQIMEKFQESSIFVMSSRYEGFGMVIIEAMSCGLPVVSFDCPYGPSDIITEGVDGYLIENGNLEIFAQKLASLMNAEDLRTEMGKAGRETARRYLPEKIVKQWDDLFWSLLNE